MYRNMIAAPTAVPVAATLAVPLAAAPAHADECFLPDHHWDASRGYCAPDSYRPPANTEPRPLRGWYNYNP